MASMRRCRWLHRKPGRTRAPLLTTRNPATVPPPPCGWFSHVVCIRLVGIGALLVVSGQLAVDGKGGILAPGDIEAQSERIFELIGHILADQGATYDDVVAIRTFVTDMSGIAGYGRARARWITGQHRPASNTVEVSRLFHPDALVEVEVMAPSRKCRSMAGNSREHGRLPCGSTPRPSRRSAGTARAQNGVAECAPSASESRQQGGRPGCARLLVRWHVDGDQV